MRLRLVLVTFLLACMVVLAACGGGTPSPSTPASLPGTSWTLGLQGGTQPAAQTPPTLTFGSDGKATGFGGCQPFSGSYTVSGSSISFTGIAKTSTSNQCAPSVLAQEDAYLGALGGATAWRIESVMPTAGVKVLEPVKLLLDGSTPLSFTLQ
jgi:heat shock protein HslJ